jgi:hypothetical protein
VVRNRDIQWAANPGKGCGRTTSACRLVITPFGVTHWKEFTTAQCKKRDRTITDAALEFLLTAADPIPYDVQRIAHELWDDGELQDRSKLDVADIGGS